MTCDGIQADQINSFFRSKDMARIRWNDGGRAEIACRACGASSVMSHVVTTPHTVHGKPDVDFYLCPVCFSVNAIIEKFTDYDEDGSFSEEPAFVRHYLQVGAGIDSMIRLLQRSNAEPGSTMIDVGCGFGFTVDFWNWAKGGGGCGVEPSLYGRLGQSVLDASISTEYLANAAQLNSRRYDRVLSSEVIEHVDDIAGFIAELRGVLAPGGVMILTTPNAEFIRPENTWSVVIAALSPGLHRVLFSRAALERALHEAGLMHVEVTCHGQQLIAFASDIPFKLSVNPEAERSEYNDYLRASIKKQRNGDLTMGFLFRYLEEQVNLGRLQEAREAWDPLCEMVRAMYNLNLRDLDEVRQRLNKAWDFEEYVGQVPVFLSAALYYAAMATLNGQDFLTDAKTGFMAAADAAEHEFSTAPSFAQKAASIYWWARIHVAVAAIQTSDHATAQRELQLLLDARLDVSAPLRPSQEQALRANRELGLSLLQSGQPERAMAFLREVIQQGGDAGRKDAGGLYVVALEQALNEVSGSLPQLAHVNWLGKRLSTIKSWLANT